MARFNAFLDTSLYGRPQITPRYYLREPRLVSGVAAILVVAALSAFGFAAAAPLTAGLKGAVEPLILSALCTVAAAFLLSPAALNGLTLAGLLARGAIAFSLTTVLATAAKAAWVWWAGGAHTTVRLADILSEMSLAMAATSAVAFVAGAVAAALCAGIAAYRAP